MTMGTHKREVKTFYVVCSDFPIFLYLTVKEKIMPIYWPLLGGFSVRI